MSWNKITWGDFFTARANEHGEIELELRRNTCPVCGEQLKKLSFKGEEEDLLTMNKPVKLKEPYLNDLELICPNCGHRTIKARSVKDT